MSLSRRDFIKLTSAASLAATLPGCKDEVPPPIEIEEPEEIIPLPTEIGDDGFPIYVEDPITGPDTLFSHGIASGDPTLDAIILWTRVSPVDTAEPVLVFWECAVDEAFTMRRGAGWVAATARRDFTAKTDARSLPANTQLYYRFRAQNKMSIVGRTKTGNATESEARFALASCSRFEHGYFAGYRAIAALENLDAVLHVGDYIYEYASSMDGVRSAQPAHEIFTLQDYRTRFAHYRGDVDLQAMHARHPMISVWDDHEIVNDAWATGMPPDSLAPISFTDRKKNALRAYAEWMPIRVNSDGSIHRAFRFGPTDLFMLDTRYEGRSEQVLISDRNGLVNPDRTLLGRAQEEWFENALASSDAQYCVVAQQVMLAQLALRGRPYSMGGPNLVNTDQWDGYQASREWMFQRLESRENPVVLTGDLHVSFANELTRDPWDPSLYDPMTGRGSIGVEILAPGITSPSNLDPSILALGFMNNPHIRYGEVTRRGFATVEFNASEMRASFHHLEDATDLNSALLPPVVLTMASGSAHLTLASDEA